MLRHNSPHQETAVSAHSAAQLSSRQRRIRRRRWIIRALLLIVLLSVVIPRYLFWAAWHERLALLKEIERMGGTYQVRHCTPDIIANWVGYRRHGIASNPAIGPFDEVYRTGFGERREGRRETPAFISRLKAFPHLETLNLSYGPATDDWMPQISELRSLRELDLSHCRVCGRGFGQLARLPHLERIGLTYCPIRNRCLSLLARSPNLGLINVSRCSHVTPDGVADLLRLWRGDPVYIHDVDGRFEELTTRGDLVEKLSTTPPPLRW